MAGPTPSQQQVTSSKDLEKVQAQIRQQAECHMSIVEGVHTCAEGINGLVEELSKVLPEASADAAATLVEGIGAILQAIADINTTHAENIQRQADSLTEHIKMLRQQESGIVVPRLQKN